jgi:23S rRNA pseudouridine1911/1915/1917 synthase
MVAWKLAAWTPRIKLSSGSWMKDFLAVDKPAGLLVHPTKPGGPRTLWNGLCELLGYELATGGQVSLVNRIDRETSGVLLVAKNSKAARAAGMAMQRGGVRKEYVALVFGWPEWDEKVVEGPIVRLGEVASSAVWLERTVHPRGAPAVTRFHVERRLSLPQVRRFSVFECLPQTGRAHQIRVHLASAASRFWVTRSMREETVTTWISLIVDGRRNGRRALAPRHALHSSRLCLELCGRKFDWSSPLPDDLAGLIESACRKVPGHHLPPGTAHAHRSR